MHWMSRTLQYVLYINDFISTVWHIFNSILLSIHFVEIRELCANDVLFNRCWLRRPAKTPFYAVVTSQTIFIGVRGTRYWMQQIGSRMMPRFCFNKLVHFAFIPTIKIGQSWYCLTFMIAIHIMTRRDLYIETPIPVLGLPISEQHIRISSILQLLDRFDNYNQNRPCSYLVSTKCLYFTRISGVETTLRCEILLFDLYMRFYHNDIVTSFWPDNDDFIVLSGIWIYRINIVLNVYCILHELCIDTTDTLLAYIKCVTLSS